MCSIIGALIHNVDTHEKSANVNRLLREMVRQANNRGRDGIGYMAFDRGQTKTVKAVGRNKVMPSPRIETAELTSCIRMIGNARAEPTTEWVKEKHEKDQQPYNTDLWSIVHNGTISNDRELRQNVRRTISTTIDSGVIAAVLADYNIFGIGTFYEKFQKTISHLKGSYAIIAAHQYDNDALYIACNYRPIWVLELPEGIFFGSSRSSFGGHYHPRMLDPYTINEFRYNWNARKLEHQFHSTLEIKRKVPRALVVCSGGLDSVVSATYVQDILGMEVELIHFQYGSRAGEAELNAVKEVADFLKVKLHVRSIPAYDPEDSNLLNPDSELAGGEAGAEFAHEWVPARNLLLLATATAFAEAKGFDIIALGNNLEEAGAYPDNEPEFIERFQDLLRFSVRDGKFLDIIQPVGRLMKHEIVNLGNGIGAPMHLTWSCYRNGKLHCGKCGPCFMRRTAFEINGIPETIQYQNV